VGAVQDVVELVELVFYSPNRNNKSSPRPTVSTERPNIFSPSLSITKSFRIMSLGLQIEFIIPDIQSLRTINRFVHGK